MFKKIYIDNYLDYCKYQRKLDSKSIRAYTADLQYLKEKVAIITTYPQIKKF